MKKYLRLIIAILLLCGLFTSICVQAGERVNPVFSTNQTPQIIVGDVMGAISACEGMASVSPAVQQFTVSGSGLSADVTVTAPGNFEISLAADGTYSNSLVLPQISGLISSITIYVRSSSQASAGNITGDVALISGAVSQTAKVTGHINALPVVNPIADQTKQNGQLTDAVAFSGTSNTYTWTNDNPAIGLPASGTGNIDKFTAINTGAIPVTAHITVSPVPASYMYASNASTKSVDLINTTTNSVELEITEGIPPLSRPSRMVFSPDKSLLYVCNEGSKTISIINTATNKVIASPSVGIDNPVGMVISPDGSKLFITDPITSKLAIFNTTTYVKKIVGTGSGTNSLAVSTDGKKLYLLNSGLLQFYDIATNFFEYGIGISGTPADIVISPDNKTLYISTTTAHDIAVVDIASRQVTYRKDITYAASKMAISTDGARLYVSNPNDNKVTVINTLTRNIITTVDVGDTPSDITISDDGSKVYVTNSLSSYITVIDAATNIADGAIQVQQGDHYTAILSDNACSGQPITFSITVNPSSTVPPTEGNGDAIVIPNSFSPNGDGANDTWIIKNINTYPHNTVEIFNRYGQRLFRSNGYGVAWDGTIKGEQLPPGTYYYIVNLKNGSKSLSGSVTIIR